jgi:hypothetical protein
VNLELKTKTSTQAKPGNVASLFGPFSPKKEKDITDFIRALLEQIKALDAKRQKVEGELWDTADLMDITKLLEYEIPAKINGKPRCARLQDQKELQGIISLLPGYHLDIRRGENGLPLYLLCRIHWDYWSGYGTIVEEIHRSPGYRIFDPRFHRLIFNRKEVNVLNLAPFRAGIADLVDQTAPDPGAHVDEALFNLAKLVFRAAWHEDQSLGIYTAECLDIMYFREAIELLYLCLSGDLCRLRNHPQDVCLSYLREKHDNPYLHQFIEHIASLSGPGLGYLPQQAMKLFSALSSSFNKFINTPVVWGVNSQDVPLYKVLFANYTRLRQIAPHIPCDENLLSQKGLLEEVSHSTINTLLQT